MSLKFRNRRLPRLKKGVQSFLIFAVATILSLIVMTYGKELSYNIRAGYAIVVVFCYTVLYLFFYQFRRGVLQIPYKILFILTILLVFLTITRVITSNFETRILLLIPFAIIPVIIRTFFDARTALFVLLIELMLSGVIIEDSFPFILIHFVAGMITIFTLDSIFRKTRVLITSFTTIISYFIIYTGISLIQDPDGFFISDFSLFVINGLSILLCYPLLAVFEKYFMMVSDATLLSLSDKTQPLLRKLADEAPGSFHHSLQVANIAEEAAREVSANAMLVRAGALYHDIGKIANANYYTENQIDNINPHDSIDPIKSASIIIGHVKKGVVLGKNYKLPSEVINFIATHHGTSVAYYFYKKYSDLHRGEDIPIKEFSYPGPKPFSKETAIVMMADAVEAASRSMTDYSEENIDNLVEKIIYLQEQDGQFTDVPLTFKDMSDIKSVFKRMLSNMYHARVIYPER